VVGLELSRSQTWCCINKRGWQRRAPHAANPLAQNGSVRCAETRPQRTCAGPDRAFANDGEEAKSGACWYGLSGPGMYTFWQRLPGDLMRRWVMMLQLTRQLSATLLRQLKGGLGAGRAHTCDAWAPDEVAGNTARMPCFLHCRVLLCSHARAPHPSRHPNPPDPACPAILSPPPAQSNNCYCYAVDRAGTDGWCLPGLGAGLGDLTGPITCADLSARVAADGAVAVPKAEALSSGLPADADSHYVALRLRAGAWCGSAAGRRQSGCGPDFHLLRQDASGLWSHKIVGVRRLDSGFESFRVPAAAWHACLAFRSSLARPRTSRLEGHTC
jgi:hypothetical protein